MLETIGGILLLLSLFGNVHQHNENQELKQEVSEAYALAEANRKEWLSVIETNKGNADVIHDLEAALDECNTRNDEMVEAVNDFRDVQRVKDAAIEALENRVADTDFAQCRVPDWVDLSSAGNSD